MTFNFSNNFPRYLLFKCRLPQNSEWANEMKKSKPNIIFEKTTIFQVVYTADSLQLDLLSLTKEGSGLMTSLGTMEWACKEIKASLPLHYRSSNSYHSNKLVKMALLELEERFYVPGLLSNAAGRCHILLRFRIIFGKNCKYLGIAKDCTMYLLQKIPSEHIKKNV